MVHKFIFGIQLILFLALVCFSHGLLEITTKPLPPPAKFLDPFQGVWHHSLPAKSGKIELPVNVVNNATIVYDNRWVPHIYAQNVSDILFLQGYVEAQNRLFQMDFIARAAAGELSALLGDATIEYDLDKRRRGMKYAAGNASKAWEKMPHYHLAKRYIDGVNAYISSLSPRDYPLEYKIFNRAPEPWSVLKSALIFKEMSLTLCGRNADIEYSNAVNSLDSATFATWYPEHEDIENPVVPDHVSFSFDSLAGAKQDPTAFVKEVLEKTFYAAKNPGVGSNQWTVGKSKTKSGANIFCNDPHLGLGLPSIWFEQHLSTPDFNAYGVSFPGFPGIMIGFNDFIAWGETNVGQDVEDLFVIEWSDPKSRDTYILNGKEEVADKRIETVVVRGRKKPVIDTVYYTAWGPVYKKSVDGKSDLAMRWISHDTPETEEYLTFIHGMQCKDYPAYLEATEPFISPAQNFGFASVSGDIAIRINGVLPAKYGQDGRFVEYGNKSSHGWQAFIPRNQNPHVVNPPENFVASANQRSASKNYPYYFTGNFENYRNRTINTKLQEINSITVDDMKSMQFNSFSAKAADFISVLPEDCNSIGNKSNKNWYLALKQWDAQYKKEKLEPVFFEVYMKNLRKETFDEILAWRESRSIAMPKDWVLFKQIKSDPNNELFNIKKTSTVENAENVQILAFYRAAIEMDSLLTANPNLNWGSYNPLHIQHMTRIPALSEMNLEADGCPDAINAKGNAFGPSWRMIVHQTRPLEAYGVYPGGQSGNPFSPYYKNMIKDWVRGEYHVLRNDADPRSISDIALVTYQIIPKK